VNAVRLSTTHDGLLPIASFKRMGAARRMIDGRIPALNAYYMGKHEQARDLYLIRARHEIHLRAQLVGYARSEHREYLRWSTSRGVK
jgi:hypothetical protein